MAKKKAKRRRRRSRFKKAADAQRQLREIEHAQLAVRRRKLKKRIDSIEKSRQRFLNSLRQIKDSNDAFEQFE